MTFSRRFDLLHGILAIFQAKPHFRHVWCVHWGCSYYSGRRLWGRGWFMSRCGTASQSETDQSCSQNNSERHLCSLHGSSFICFLPVVWFRRGSNICRLRAGPNGQIFLYAGPPLLRLRPLTGQPSMGRLTGFVTDDGSRASGVREEGDSCRHVVERRNIPARTPSAVSPSGCRANSECSKSPDPLSLQYEVV